MIITCPACKNKLPDIWGGRYPKPKRGEVIECGMCAAYFQFGPPHEAVPRLELHAGAGEVTITLSLKEQKVAWHCSPADARRLVQGILEAAEKAEPEAKK